MTAFEKEYHKTVQERSDAFMRYVAAIIAEEFMKELDAVEKEMTGVEVPPDLDHKIRNIIREFEKKERHKVRKQQLKAMGKIAAVVILCLVTVSTVLVVTVDAFRIKVMDFLLTDHGEYMDVNVVEPGYIPDEVRNQLPESWEDIFYPAILPKGYTFAEAYELGNSKTLLFADEEENVISFTYGPTGEGQTMIDSEDSQIVKTEINGNPAIYFIKENRTILHWNQNGFDYNLVLFLPLEQGIEIVENIKYINLK